MDYTQSNIRNINFKNIATIVAISLVVYAGLIVAIVAVEKNDPGANICTIFDAVWWSVVTITTVGFGDKFPVTVNGRIIGFVFLLISLSFYAILIGRITNLITNILENRKMGHYGMKFIGHSVILGWGPFGKMVTDQLVAAGKKVAVVTREKDSIDLIREAYSPSEVFTLYSDLSNVDILDKVNITESSIVFVNLDDDTEKLVQILNIKKHYQKLKFIVTMNNGDLKDTFISAGVKYAISKTGLAAKLLASYIFEPHVASYNEEIISYASTEDDYDMKEFLMMKDCPYVGRSYNDAFFDLKKDCNAILVGIAKQTESGRELLKNPENSVIINKGDYLLMIANQKAERKIVKIFGTQEGYLG